MRELSIREMRAALGNLAQIMEDEGEVIITRHGKPVARVLPVKGRRPIPSHRKLRESAPRAPVPSEVRIREDRDER